jgi:phage portal protein BeeE
MMLLAQASFKFRSMVDKHLFGSEDLRILEYPWPNGTSSDLLARMEQDASQEGNAYVVRADSDRLVRLPPSEVTIVSNEYMTPVGRFKEVVGYEWDPAMSMPGTRQPDKQTFTVDEVAHWAPYPDPVAKVRGMSWLTPVLKEINADLGMTRYKTSYMDHGQPVAGIKYSQKLRSDSIDTAQERIMAKLGGLANAWKPWVFDQGADPIMGAGLQGLDFRNVQAGGEARICSAAGVPEIVVGLRSAEPGEQYAAAMRHFGDTTCRYLWGSACAALEKLVPNMPPKGVQLWYDTADIAALQAAETERAQVIQVSAAAMLTLNQAGYTRDSVIKAVTSGDLSQLVPDPNAPTPGVVERETITGPSPFNTAGKPEDPNLMTSMSTNGRPAVKGVPPGGGQTLTQPQTPASKKPMPASFPTAKTAAPNGKGA